MKKQNSIGYLLCKYWQKCPIYDFKNTCEKCKYLTFDVEKVKKASERNKKQHLNCKHEEYCDDFRIGVNCLCCSDFEEKEINTPIVPKLEFEEDENFNWQEWITSTMNKLDNSLNSTFKK